MNRKHITLLLATFIGLAASLLSGCNTSRGFGEDIEKVGEEIQEAIDS